MNEKIIRCPICERIVRLEKRAGLFDRSQTMSKTHAITWGRMGYSRGGWGFRQDWIGEFSSGDVCEECFLILERKINEFVETIEKRKGCNREGICIYREVGVQGDKVPNVRNGKLQLE